ncbi:Glutamine amidotransferase subunit pdxT [Sebaldella termitidis]|jgi:5'-phosphate synthase pdxT subunit|uniref:Pyridoxal 5'-phosphate synthase subunit PdxT n=1 Tax=Sebaldella termitidis (strain ATCC 33386 / NCTC 11300) TaxID=526218 RepID=D1AKC2_SEBTE|nr:pyridoxal 5'-phosphate synthase glutaminase subunit PdxT [Sebaldella termitidis]ACZ09038.1 SNO glutamine amidotransferase [Sebaldella termitidis ATCC 33386]SUI24357.1 Glutamine amidotransferase subunit pdxT [Sebaldella termitidis]
MNIGILALQGAFKEHKDILDKLEADSYEIRKKSDLKKRPDGLIIPGGESTVIGKLLNDLDMMEELKNMIENGIPVFGTCAGLILLAKKIENDKRIHLGCMNIEVQRNAYGRQLGSFVTEEEFQGIGKIPMVFIRAPYIKSIGNNVKILSEVKGKIIAAEEKNILVTAFHPELTKDTRVHKYFIEKITE